MAIQARFDPATPTPGGRAAERRTVRLTVQGSHTNGEDVLVLIHNISEQGLLLETEAALTIGEEFLLTLPEAEDAWVEVAWASGHLFGCRFRTHVSAAALSAIQLQSAPATAEAHASRAEVVSEEPFHIRLSRLRKRAGVSVGQLSEAMGVSRLSVWNWERGKARPRATRCSSLAKALQVSERELLTGHHEDERDLINRGRRSDNASQATTSSFDRSVKQEARLLQLINASKDQIAALAGTSPEKIRITLEY